jgi:serine O-acetyltransferase
VIDELKDDYVRHGGHLRHTGLWVLGVYRFGRWAQRLEPRPARWTAGRVYWALNLGVEVALGVVLPRRTRIGEQLLIVHGASIRVHPDVVIGDRVCLMHEVTLGLNSGPEGARTGAPRIGNDVFIGAGAKVLGGITVGDGARIAANSLVVTDVPAGATVIGVPARVMRTRANDSPASPIVDQSDTATSVSAGRVASTVVHGPSTAGLPSSGADQETPT